jgi:hypothetical protein
MINNLSSARLPKLFKPQRCIAIPKSGKDGSDPVLTYFVAECDVQRIQPLIEAATPFYPAGFRKHRKLHTLKGVFNAN